MLGTPTRDRIAERRAATRREILDAAWQIAREQGLAQLTLRDVAQRVGMRAPSLYTHFESKNAIYDAMFGEAWTELLAVMRAVQETQPSDAREVLRLYARTFFEFAVDDLPRHQLMNRKVLPGFEPSPEAYAPSVESVEAMQEALAAFGVTDPEAIDLYVAVVGGLIDAQLANDYGGDRYLRLLDRAIDMLADEIGLPPTPASRRERP